MDADCRHGYMNTNNDIRKKLLYQLIEVGNDILAGCSICR